MSPISNTYKPAPIKYYLPLVLVFSTSLLIIINWFIYKLKGLILQHLVIATFLLLVISMVFIFYQIITKEFISYIKSLILTKNIRQMLVIPAETNNYTGQTKINNVNNIYNSCLKYTYAEYKENKLYICLRIPNNLTASKLLEDRMQKLWEAIDSSQKEYSFSNLERQGHYYIRSGRK